MTAYLPPNLLALFAARDPIEYWPPIERPEHHRELPITGIAQYVSLFEDPADTPAPVQVETREERRERKRKEKAEQIAYKVEQDLALWNPSENPTATKDPYKTLFIARISYDTTESKLKREFEVYGPIKNIKLIKDTVSGKPRGIASLSMNMKETCMNPVSIIEILRRAAAYKHADGKKIDGRRVLVDVERARTVKNWRPRRLGGGLGNTRKGAADQTSKFPDKDKDHDRKKKSRSRDRRDKDRDRKRERSRSDRKKKRSRSKERRKHRSRSHGKKVSERAKGKSKEKSRDRKKKKDRDNGVVSAIQKYGEYGADME